MNEDDFASWVEETNQKERDKQRRLIMGRGWIPDEVPASQDLPADNYDCEIDKLEETTTKQARKLMYVATFKVRFPKIFAGRSVMEWINIGEEGCLIPDVNSSNKAFAERSRAVWLKNGARLKQIFEAVGVKPTGDLDADIKAVVRKRIGITLVMQPETQKMLDEKGDIVNAATGNYRSRIARNGYFAMAGPNNKPARPIGAAYNEAVKPQQVANGTDQEPLEEAAADEQPEEAPAPPPRRAKPQPAPKQFDEDNE